MRRAQPPQARGGGEVSRVDELRDEIARARSGLRQAIEFAAFSWDRARAPRPDEDVVWSPRQVAEHIIAGEVGSAATITQALGGALERLGPLELPDAEAALRALDDATTRSDSPARSPTATRSGYRVLGTSRGQFAAGTFASMLGRSWGSSNDEIGIVSDARQHRLARPPALMAA
jgi:hypothetical protein